MPKQLMEQAIQKKAEFAKYLQELTHDHKDGSKTSVFEQVYEYPQATLPEHKIFVILELNDMYWVRATIYILIEDVAESEKQLYSLRDIFFYDLRLGNLRGGRTNYLHLGDKFYRTLTYFSPVE